MPITISFDPTNETEAGQMTALLAALYGKPDTPAPPKAPSGILPPEPEVVTAPTKARKAKPAPAPAPEPAPEKATLKQTIGAVAKLQQEKGLPAVREVLREFGAKKMADVPADQYGKLITACEACLEEDA